MFIEILLLFAQIHSKIITIDNIEYIKYRPNILLYFTNEKQTDMSLLNTFLSYSVFKLPKDVLIKENILDKKVLHLDRNYSSVLYRSDFKLNNDALINGTYNYIVNEKDTMLYRNKGLALGYHIEEKFSIIHQLYKNKQIEHLQFVFNNISPSLEGNFFIGGVPNEEHLTLPYKGVVKVDESLP